MIVFKKKNIISGIGTASVYCDVDLKQREFPFECHRKFENVVVVKTHDYSQETIGTFERAIVLIRNPYDAIFSYYNLDNGFHMGHAPNAAFFSDG